MADAGRKKRGAITPADYDAVLFDLDGVLTKTAEVHAKAWKQTFDAFLERRAAAKAESLVPFDIAKDYTKYVDGKPRYDGVKDFLASRAIELPHGDPSDTPGDDTVCAVGNRKNDLVVALLKRDGVEAYEGSVKLLHYCRAAGVKTAVVSSSKNCLDVINAAGIGDQFDARVDGAIAAERGLAGKPAPDTYLAAAKELGVPIERAVVIEDALSGVQSGRAGNFGLVVGVNRQGDADALREHGADVVVDDLATLIPK